MERHHQNFGSCYVFVDGQYIRKAFRDARESHPELHDEVDPTQLISLGVRYGIENHVQLIPTRVFFYDALDEEASEQEVERQKNYFLRLSGRPSTHVRLGDVRKGQKTRPEQKGVDVQLAVDALQAAHTGKVEAIALVTGDADFVPLVKALRDVGPQVMVFGLEGHTAASLLEEADEVHLWPKVVPQWLVDSPTNGTSG